MTVALNRKTSGTRTQKYKISAIAILNAFLLAGFLIVVDYLLDFTN